MEPNLEFLPLSVRRYLDRVFSLLSALLEKDLVALYVFGSVVGGECCDTSDLDLLIVLDDGTPSQLIRYVDGLLESLEAEYELVSADRSLVGRVLRAIERSTGMFVSHFLCRRSDLLRGRFSKVFSTNLLMSKLLAPASIVFGSVLSRKVKVYGEDILGGVTIPKPSRLTLLKSLAMNLLLSLFSLLLYPLTPRANRYEMEAAKWSILASYYFLKKTNPGLNEALKFFAELGLPKTYCERLLQLRMRYENDVRFGLSTPCYVLKIHVKALNRVGLISMDKQK
ncbi:MAG: nucleotidyltransferase domain-containing protein [Candidatus Freyarchaeota archaeon]